MKDKSVKLIIRYGISIGLAGILAWLITTTYHLAEVTSKVERYRILCDAFTVPGVLFLMVGILIKIMDCGAIDGLSYAMRTLSRVFIPFAVKEDEAFIDYIHRKREERKGRNTGFIMHVGILFLIPAIIFLILFYQIY